jgi:hypothetical protein
MNLAHAGIVRTAESQVVAGTVNRGSRRCDLFAAGAAHKLVEPRLRLAERGLGLSKSRIGPARVLAHQDLALCNGFTFGNKYLDYGFGDLGREFNAIRGQFAHDAVAILC